MRYEPSEDEIALYATMIEDTFNEVKKTRVRNPDKFILSTIIVREIIKRFFSDKKLIEDCHSGLDGSDECKVAGYLTYWISKLKPVMILEPEPNENEIFINEDLAIDIAIPFIYQFKKVFMLFPKKVLDDLKYTLRYRTLTVRVLPIIFEAYVFGCNDGWKAVTEFTGVSNLYPDEQI